MVRTIIDGEKLNRKENNEKMEETGLIGKSGECNELKLK